jgi:TRAP-type C4-dicarboxylate transport system substrate-binding protein
MFHIRHRLLRAVSCCMVVSHVLLLLNGGVAGAQAVQVPGIATPYPRDTVSGRGIERFAQLLAQPGRGRITMRVGFLAGRPDDVVQAVQSGQLAAGDTLASSLVALDPVFELSMLPFEVRTPEEARRLADLARPAYEQALMRHGLHLLYVSPWPPSGLWSRETVNTVRDLAGLRIRTYDEASAAFLSALGSQAVPLPIGEVVRRIHAGTLDGVLSSGDGDVGRLLRTALPHFAAINYAYPLSFALMSQSRYDALPLVTRERIDAASAATEQQQWASIPERIARNREEMQRGGVIVAMPVGDELSDGLRRRGDAWVVAWQARVLPAYAGIVRQYRESGSATRDPDRSRS